MMKLLSDCEDGTTAVETIEDTTDNTNQRQMINCKTLLMRSNYLQHMGYVDDANSDMMSYRFRHGLFRWKVATLLWMIKLAIHNARIYFNSRQLVRVTLKGFIMEGNF